MDGCGRERKFQCAPDLAAFGPCQNDALDDGSDGSQGNGTGVKNLEPGNLLEMDDGTDRPSLGAGGYGADEPRSLHGLDGNGHEPGNVWQCLDGFCRLSLCCPRHDADAGAQRVAGDGAV